MDANVTSTFHAPDIECDHCLDTIRAVLARLEGVDGVAVDLDAGIIHVEHDQARVTVPAIRAALEEAGYPTSP